MTIEEATQWFEARNKATTMPGAMTTEEAIARIQDHMEVHGIGAGRHKKISDALNMAIAALRAQQKAEED